MTVIYFILRNDSKPDFESEQVLRSSDMSGGWHGKDAMSEHHLTLSFLESPILMLSFFPNGPSVAE